MAKLYSFYWHGERCIFFHDGSTTWWPSSFVFKKLGVSLSPSLVFKKCNISFADQKRFHEFHCSLIFFPKLSYFISAAALEKVLKSSLVDSNTGEVQELQKWLDLANPFLEESLLAQQVVEKLSFPSKTPPNHEAGKPTEQLEKIILQLLILTKQLTIDLQMQTSMETKTKELGLEVTKTLSNYFRKHKKLDN